VPLTDVSKRLGHVNPHVTATIYAHALPGRDDLAAAAWEKFQREAASDNRTLKAAAQVGLTFRRLWFRGRPA